MKIWAGVKIVGIGYRRWGNINGRDSSRRGFPAGFMDKNCSSTVYPLQLGTGKMGGNIDTIRRKSGGKFGLFEIWDGAAK